VRVRSTTLPEPRRPVPGGIWEALGRTPVREAGAETRAISASTDIVPTTSDQEVLVRAQAVGKTKIAVPAALHNGVCGVEIAAGRVNCCCVQYLSPCVAVAVNGHFDRC
jgi:hypothetical protein